MNNVNIIGRITNDLEIRVVGNDLKVLTFSIACNRRMREKEEVSFFEVTSWGRQAEVIATYFKKGHRIGISGRLKQDRFEDKDGNKRSKVSIVLVDFTFIEQRSDNVAGGGAQGYAPRVDSAQSSPSSGAKEADFSQFTDIPTLDDDVPF